MEERREEKVIRILGPVAVAVLLPVLLTGCFTDTMPDIQGTVVNVRYVEPCGQPATRFIDQGGTFSPSLAFAIVPQVEISNRDRIAIYVIADDTLNIVINGQDKSVKASLYRLGAAGVSVAEGWDWRHDLAELEQQMEEHK